VIGADEGERVLVERSEDACGKDKSGWGVGRGCRLAGQGG